MTHQSKMRLSAGMANVTRRAVLLGAAAIALLPLAAASRTSSGTSDLSILSMLKRPADAARIGRQVLRYNPELGDNEVALQHIKVVQNKRRISETPKESVFRQVRRDFEAGDVVTVDGWILSRTEACLYVLAAQHKDRKQLS